MGEGEGGRSARPGPSYTEVSTSCLPAPCSLERKEPSIHATGSWLQLQTQGGEGAGGAGSGSAGGVRSRMNTS